ncbi:hypothetical protein [Phenylobacterium sp. 58.2.17]|uniref:hypothetical protein n=1 Tax=Phenylobacterium sp. 58.2.17 TaxID=2969306 RepID=UPI002265488D|nr:hypothetical protein [Phenylobacterium sp. 58.2.17]MCX7587190.1 hypothetical protein [Phenylobacterium sp. 58.2.17]
MTYLDWLRPALVDATVDELIAELASGRAQLWLAERSALVTELVGQGSDRCLHIWLAGGSLVDILGLRPGLEAWARGQGCSHITIDGRPGWIRVLRRHGYRLAGRELKRTL